METDLTHSVNHEENNLTDVSVLNGTPKCGLRHSCRTGQAQMSLWQSHVQRTQQDDGYMGKQRSGREDGQLGDSKKVRMEEHQNDQGVLGWERQEARPWLRDCGRCVSLHLS